MRKLHHAGMSDGGSSREDVAARLTLLRIRMGFESQNAWAKRMGMTPSHWNHFETGGRPLTLSVANTLRARTGVTIDWLLHGDRSGLSVQMASLLPDLSDWRAEQAESA